MLDDIEELENKAIETQPLFDENDINKKADRHFSATIITLQL